MKKQIIPIEVSARHIHLSQKDLDKLFSKNYSLKIFKKLSQVEMFAAKEKVKSLNFDLRIVGPVRKESQIEISKTEAIKFGINAELKLSGDLKNVRTFLEVQGPKGKINVKVIVAKRHLHCSKQEAKKLNLKNNQKVSVKILNERALIFENVIVRVADNFNLACHIDTDEANACGLGKVCGIGELII